MDISKLITLCTFTLLAGEARADLPLVCSVGNDGSVIAQVTNTTGSDQQCSITCPYVEQGGANRTYKCDTSVSNGVYNFVVCQLQGAHARAITSPGTISCVAQNKAKK
jgi:hypothetical protein